MILQMPLPLSVPPPQCRFRMRTIRILPEDRLLSAL